MTRDRTKWKFSSRSIPDKNFNKDKQDKRPLAKMGAVRLLEGKHLLTQYHDFGIYIHQCCYLNLLYKGQTIITPNIQYINMAIYNASNNFQKESDIMKQHTCGHFLWHLTIVRFQNLYMIIGHELCYTKDNMIKGTNLTDVNIIFRAQRRSAQQATSGRTLATCRSR